MPACMFARDRQITIMQEGQLLSFGRPTYGRLGRLDVAASSDNAASEAMPVDGLDGLTVVGMSAGKTALHSLVV